MLICFDLGGVLIRICRTWDEGCIAAGVPVRTFDVDDEHLATRRTLIASLQRGDLGDSGFHSSLSKAFRGTWSPEEVARVDQAWVIEPYPDVLELVDRIAAAGHPTACLSNTSADHWRTLEAFEVVARLDHRFASHLMRRIKPDPRIYRDFEAGVGRDPGEIVFFDDLPANVEAARGRGWDAVRIDHEGDPARQMADALTVRGLI